jgi:hypothetical protein
MRLPWCWNLDTVRYFDTNGFNTSTAFSPTDAPVLAKWAKVLMMLQSLLSLLIIALLAARAVNILLADGVEASTFIRRSVERPILSPAVATLAV